MAGRWAPRQNMDRPTETTTTPEDKTTGDKTTGAGGKNDGCGKRRAGNDRRETTGGKRQVPGRHFCLCCRADTPTFEAFLSPQLGSLDRNSRTCNGQRATAAPYQSGFARIGQTKGRLFDWCALENGCPLVSSQTCVGRVRGYLCQIGLAAPMGRQVLGQPRAPLRRAG
jgi:hypothetical protein